MHTGKGVHLTYPRNLWGKALLTRCTVGEAAATRLGHVEDVVRCELQHGTRSGLGVGFTIRRDPGPSYSRPCKLVTNQNEVHAKCTERLQPKTREPASLSNGEEAMGLRTRTLQHHWKLRNRVRTSGRRGPVLCAAVGAVG